MSQMVADIKCARYAHSEGHTAGCFAYDGAHVITCGSDCDVRKWACNGEEDDDDDGQGGCPSTITLREPATCIIFNNDTIYLGSGNFVETYKYPVLKSLNERPLRFSATVTHIDISANGDILVAGSCDMKIKIKNFKTGEITEISGHTAPILRVALDPTVKYLVSSSCDGTARVWDILTSEMVKTFNNVVPSNNDFFTAKSLGGSAWERHKGLYLAVINGNKISVYSTDKWSLDFELTYSKVEKLISLLSFSSCGKYLCAGTTVGELVVWNFKARQVVSYIEHPQKACICALSWHPTTNDISYCDRLGRVCILSPKLNQLTKDSENKISISKDRNEDEALKYDNGHDGNDDGDDDDDDENSISITQIKASTGFLPDDKSVEKEDDESSEEDYNTKTGLTFDLQPCFQPSSTPSHFQHGYMVWNSIGIVRSFNGETESSIDVEFHDTMLHHSIHRRNLHEYFIASLSSNVLCLASSSILTGINLNAWDEKKEWSICMPSEENIVAVAASGNWVCCATDANHLRVFTHTGTQRQLLSLSGPVVCMNSHGELLIVITHIGPGLPECQNLGYAIFEISDFFVRALTPCNPVALSPKSKLKWAGFTDEGTPCLYDSSGLVRLSRDFLVWEVMCDTRAHCKNQSDNYFLIGVSERLQSVRCIFCKGSWYPMTAPRPTVVEIPLKIPLCEPDEDKTTLEDIFWRHMFAMPVMEELSKENYEYRMDLNSWEKILKQTVIKLFADAYRHRADMRAINIASLMSEQPLEMAIKLVQGEGRMYLVDKLCNLKPKDWKELRVNTRGRVSDTNTESYSRILNNDNENRFVSEFRNKYTHKSSPGDMFEDSQPSPSMGIKQNVGEDKADSSLEDKNSLKEASPSTNMTSNPFKINKKGDQGLKGLDFFNNVKQSSLKPAKPDATASNKGVKSKGNPSKEKANQPKKITFVDWFSKEKKSLQEKFPGLSNNELTKAAMKIYREEISQGQKRSDPPSFNGENESLPGAKRQKLEENDKSNVQKETAEKLSAFNFMK